MRILARSLTVSTLLSIATFVNLGTTQLWADTIIVNVTNSSLQTTPGGRVTFDGRITNTSGTDLNATDFFFNFVGFDPLSVNPAQDLGVATEFLIPDGSTSGVVALFDVTLGAVAPGSIFPMQFQLQDINSDFSSESTVYVTVPGNSSVPEPSGLVLLVTGIFTAYAVRARRSGRSRPSK